MADEPLDAPEIPGLTYLRKLGAGGYADVYLYEQRMPSRKVAVKVLRDAGLAAGVVVRFTAEANAMAQLEHPHIVPVYSAGATSDGRPYLVMMYYPQASLSERAKRERFSVGEVLRIGIQIASAVETAHRAGLLHRDIKPANILTSQYGTPGLTDFGIAAQIAESDDDDTGVSVPWSPVETLYVTSPASVRSDVYSLAATLWHLLVGRSPFEIPRGDNSTFALMRRIRDVPAPSTGRSDVPTSLDRLLRGAMAKDPALRPASALQFARSLQAIEQELRLPRTEIVVARDEAVPPPVPVVQAVPAPESDATRIQAPQRVIPQRPLPPITAPSLPPVTTPPPADSAPVQPPRPSPGYQEGTATVLRAVVPSHDAAEPTPGAVAEESRPRWGVIALAAVVAMATIVGGVWLLSGWGRPPAVAVSTPSVSTPTPDLGPDTLPPGDVTIKAKRSGSTVTFTWTYAGALPSDNYRIKVDGTQQATSEPDWVVNDAADEVCLAVMVLRADGANSQTAFSKEVCG